jgi:ferredoxin-NADP reductase
MATIWHEGVVTQIIDETATTKRFTVKVQGEETFRFRAGQFVTMDLPIHERRLKRWRSYSIANAPNEDNILEFCIVKLEGGAGTTYLFNEILVGSTITFKGADGVFYLPKGDESNLVFVCTGTGIAPFRSMIMDLVNQRQLTQQIHLIFGTRHAEGILYESEWKALAAAFPNFNYSIALSRESKEGYHNGYVHDIYKKIEKTENTKFYLCGWSAMIDEAVVNLQQGLGYEKSQIHYELYG